MRKSRLLAFDRHVAIAMLFLMTLPVFALDPGSSRELERQTKSEQARLLRERHPRVFGKGNRTSVSIDAYHFDLTINPSGATLHGTVTLDLSARHRINRVTLDSVELDVSNVWYIDAAGDKQEAPFETTSETLTAYLPRSLEKDSKFSISVAYSVVGDRRDGRALSVDRGLFFVNGDATSKLVAPTVYTSSQPQLARTWFPCLDDPALKAQRMTMRVKVPDGWYALSNGALKEARDEPSTKSRVYDWEERFPIPSYLISLAASPYGVIEDRAGDIPVQYFVAKGLESQARHDFGRTPEMIEYFSKLWRPYPFEKYAMATVPYYHGAMEHTTATTMSDAHVNGDRESEETVAHELAHHWWGNMVTAATWDDLWLNEGFATYAEVLFDERFKGQDQALDSLLWNQSAYFRFDQEGIHAVVDPLLPADEKFNPATYEKAAWVLHMLRAQLGDELFFKAANEYLNSFAFKNATTEDLRKAFERTSGRDLGDFFSQWIRGRGYPLLSVNWSYDRPAHALSVTVAQKQERQLFRQPLDVLVGGRGAGGKTVFHAFKIQVSERLQTFNLNLPEEFPEPRGIWVDPNLHVLKKAPVDRRSDEVRFWLGLQDIPGQAAWLARLDALEGMMSTGAVSFEVAREVLNVIESEKATPVRVAMFDLLAVTEQKLRPFDENDVGVIQKIIAAGLVDTSLEVRAAAASAAAEFLSPVIVELLIDRFRQEPSVRVREMVVRSIARSKHEQAFALFYGELQASGLMASHRRLAQAILEGLGALGDDRAAAILMDFANGGDPFLQTTALESLGGLRVPATFSSIVAILSDLGRAVDLRVSAARALANYGGIPAARALDAQFQIEKNEIVKKAIKSALDGLGGAPDLKDLSVKGSPALLRW